MHAQDFEKAPKGKLVQWTLDDGRVLRTLAEIEDAMHTASDSDFDMLCEVQDHFGHECVLVEVFEGDKPKDTLLVRFADGATLYAWDQDARFD